MPLAEYVKSQGFREHYGERQVVATASHAVYMFDARLAPFLLDEPLFNDLQRVPACPGPDDCDAPEEYGPLVLFERFKYLDQLTDAHYNSGNWIPAGGMRVDIQNFDRLIVSEPYEVRIRRDGSGSWFAALKDLSGNFVYQDLPVRRESFASTPAVTLVDFDDNDERTVFGVRCGAGWCRFALDGEPPSVRPARCPKGVTWTTCSEPGWSDVQRLAKGPTGRLKRNGPQGRFIPKPSLRSDLLFSGWELWGVVHVNRKYEKTIGSATLTIHKGLNQIFLFGTNTAKPRFVHGALVAQPRGSQTPEVQYFTLELVTHGLSTAPGAARWQWRPDDEGFWEPCGPGCCELYSLQGVSNPTGGGVPSWEPM